MQVSITLFSEKRRYLLELDHLSGLIRCCILTVYLSTICTMSSVTLVSRQLKKDLQVEEFITSFILNSVASPEDKCQDL